MLTKERSQQIATLLLKPIVEQIDFALRIDPNMADDCEQLVKTMGKNLSTAQAVSGILLNMDSVDKRVLEYQTFKAVVKLVIQRKKQQVETVEIAAKAAKEKQGLNQTKKALGF